MQSRRSGPAHVHSISMAPGGRAPAPAQAAAGRARVAVLRGRPAQRRRAQRWSAEAGRVAREAVRACRRGDRVRRPCGAGGRAIATPGLTRTERSCPCPRRLPAAAAQASAQACVAACHVAVHDAPVEGAALASTMTRPRALVFPSAGDRPPLPASTTRVRGLLVAGCTAGVRDEKQDGGAGSRPFPPRRAASTRPAAARPPSG